jgi:ribonuclease G
VTDGPREVMTRKCPTCGGDGIVYSEASAAIDVERRLRALANGSRSQAFKVELAAPIAAALTGPGARRLMELEAMTKRRFFLAGKPDTHADHFVVLGEGKLADVAPGGPVEEGAELMVELVEVDRHDAAAGVAHLDGIDVCVGDAAELVGKKVKVKIERAFDGVAYASLVRKSTKKAPEPLTAEAEAEKPTRKPPARKTDADADVDAVEGDPDEAPAEVEIEAAVEEAAAADETEDADEPTETPEGAAVKKKTRRGSRGGRNRKKKPAAAAGEATEETEEEEQPAEEAAPAAKPKPKPRPAAKKATIHLPPDDLGEEAAPEDGDGSAPAVKKKTRRGSRGGKNRRKREAAAETNGAEPEAHADEPVTEASSNGAQPATPELRTPEPTTPQPKNPEPTTPERRPTAEPAAEPEEQRADANEENWGYVPMSQWGDEFE